MANEDLYADVEFESAEGPNHGRPISIRLSVADDALPSLGLGTDRLHLMARDTATLAEIDDLARRMRDLLQGIELVTYRYPSRHRA